MRHQVAISNKVLLWVVAIAFFMQMLDTTIINTALPSVAEYFGENALEMHYVVISYLLTVAFLVPISGWLAERFGVKKVFIASVFIFTLGSLFCSLSGSLTQLILSRIVQGVGGALMMPVGRFAAISAYSKSEMVKVMSFITIPGLIGPIMGPVIGGILVQYFHWGWIFFINVPVGIICMIAAAVTMQKPKERIRTKFDWRGFMLFGVSVILITLALDSLESARINWGRSGSLFAAGVILMFFYTQFSFSHPFTVLFSPRMFYKRSFSIGILTNVVSRIGSGAMPFITPLFMQTVLGFSPLKTGITLLPMGLASIMAKFIINPLLNKMGYRAFLTFNTILLGILLCFFAIINKVTPYYLIIILVSVLGVANSMQFTAMNTLTLIDLPRQYLGEGNSLLSVIMQISLSVSVAAASGFLMYFGGADAQQGGQQMLKAFHGAYLCLGTVSFLSSLIFITPISRGIVTKPSMQK
jgi:EmrB/QacA subfamily drug resistance transporter